MRGSRAPPPASRRRPEGFPSVAARETAGERTDQHSRGGDRGHHEGVPPPADGVASDKFLVAEILEGSTARGRGCPRSSAGRDRPISSAARAGPPAAGVVPRPACWRPYPFFVHYLRLQNGSPGSGAARAGGGEPRPAAGADPHSGGGAPGGDRRHHEGVPPPADRVAPGHPPGGAPDFERRPSGPARVAGVVPRPACWRPYLFFVHYLRLQNGPTGPGAARAGSGEPRPAAGADPHSGGRRAGRRPSSGAPLQRIRSPGGGHPRATRHPPRRGPLSAADPFRPGDGRLAGFVAPGRRGGQRPPGRVVSFAGGLLVRPRRPGSAAPGDARLRRPR